MEKYPVTSELGNIYMVNVRKCRLFVDHYEVGIYHQYKGLFNRKKYQLLNKSFMGTLPSYDAKKYNFDLVLMVKSIIKNMEDNWEEIKNKNKLLDNAEKYFENWNGEC